MTVRGPFQPWPLSDSVILSVRNSSFKLRIAVLVTGSPYGTRDQNNIIPARRDRFFNFRLRVFWPTLSRHVQLQVQLKSFICLPD